MNTVTRSLRILHNEELDGSGRHVAWTYGYRTGDRMVEVLTTEVTIDEELRITPLAGQIFAVGNYQHSSMPELAEVASLYAAAQLRSLSVGDVLVIDGHAVAVARHGWVLTDTPEAIEHASQ